MSRFTRILLTGLFLVSSSPALGQSVTDYPPEIEERAREVGHQLRCVVCQNQSIEESDAELAADMRRLVRERLVDGDSEAEIIAQMRDRYGDFVLLKPPVQSNTLILWLAPLFLVLVFIVWWVLSARRPSASPANPELSDDEKKRLKALRDQSQ